jgi:hypothetical protein
MMIAPALRMARQAADAFLALASPLKHPELFHSVSIIDIALPIFATPFIARPALGAFLTVIAVPPVYSIGTTSGGPNAAMSDKVANNSTDDRTLDATARPRIRLTREGNGGKAKDCRNEKQLFHGWLLINFQLFRRTLVHHLHMPKSRYSGHPRACQSKLAMRKEHAWTDGPSV